VPVIQTVTSSFRLELPVLIHDFTAGTGDTFKIALYTDAATINRETSTYTTTGEVVGTGYTAGGAVLTSVTPVLIGQVTVFDFADVSWPTSSITARGALIYNFTKANRSVCTLDFGFNRTSSFSTFAIEFPVSDSNNAILRID